MSLKEHILYDTRGLITEKSFLNENNARQGVCQFFTHGRLSSEVTYTGGLRHGPSTYYHPNGKPHMNMSYTHDYLEGERKIFDEHGELMLLETYKNGQLHGPYKSYHSNAALHQEGQFDDHLKVGAWETFDAKGKLISSEQFEKGIRISEEDE